MATAPHIAIRGLPILDWRGLGDAPPYTSASFTITHVQNERAYSRINGSGHDYTGRAAIPMSFQLWFVNGIEGRNDLFPELWEKWFAALDDGSPGELVHPLLGPIDARVLDFSATVEAATTAGVVCTVNFTDTVIDPTKDRRLSRPQFTLSALAAAFAGEVTSTVDFPDGASPLDLLDLLKQLEGAAFAITNSIDGLVNKVKGVADTMIRLLEGANDHIHYATIGILQQIWMAADETAKNHGLLLPREIGSALADVDTTFATLARERDNTVAELMDLNSGLLGSPIIPAGAAIKFFAA